MLKIKSFQFQFQTDGTHIADFIKGLNRQHKIMILLGGLSLPFDHETTTLIKWFISSAVAKIREITK